MLSRRKSIRLDDEQAWGSERYGVTAEMVIAVRERLGKDARNLQARAFAPQEPTRRVRYAADVA